MPAARSSNLPLVDLEPVLAGGDGARAASQIGSACRETGFFLRAFRQTYGEYVLGKVAKVFPA